ncbi:MAG: ATP-binding cassette domain-containing protein [Eubacteriales bacterium]|nr:ATP-binding cassette domain-containing protein [Eubacteriales bacterium]
MILACQNISKAFGTEEILKNISFHLEDHDKAALIGVNGAGKSTLLRVITGELIPDSGEVTMTHGKTLGYLAQYQEMEGNHTIYEEVKKGRQHVLDMEIRLREMEEQMKHTSGDAQAALMDSYTRLTHTFELENGYAVESEIVGVLKGLGFEEKDFDRTLSTLSGGQKTRVVLGKLLLTKPDILLLDEPTNHLDMSSIVWLENYLMNYAGTVLIVSHDRYFLNRIVNRVIEIEFGKCMTFEGNYNDFYEKKAIIRKAQMNAWKKQQAEIKHQEEVITKLKQFNREKSIKRAESREKMLDKIERLDKPEDLTADMRIELTPRIESGMDVLTVEGLTKSFPGMTLFENQSFEIKRGERLAIIGNNGTGKTTILKILNGLLEPDAGKIRLGTKVHIGYYDQEHQLLHPEKTIFQEIADSYPTLTQTQIRNVLAAFLFTNDDVYKLISSLSGGERGRVSLARLMLSEANFLILDEPTNHLDIVSKEILEDALKSYTGTVLFVSHDRYFINQTATRILDLNNGTLVNYIGNYDYYMEKREELTEIYASSASVSEAETADAAASADSAAGGKMDWQAQKESQARQRKKENEIRKVEEKIAELEARNKEIDEEFLKPETGTDLPKCQKLSKEQNAINEQLEELYEKWEILSED